jgi:hypothetical protein
LRNSVALRTEWQAVGFPSEFEDPIKLIAGEVRWWGGISNMENELADLRNNTDVSGNFQVIVSKCGVGLLYRQ